MTALRFSACPNCGNSSLARLPVGWQKLVLEGFSIPIVACGNPWHYVFASDGLGYEHTPVYSSHPARNMNVAERAKS